MTVDAATGRSRMFSRRNLLVECGTVALPADCFVVPRRILPARNIMWIVAGNATQLALALQKTGRTLHPVGGTYDLVLVVAALPRRVVDEHAEMAHRLPWPT